MNRQAVPILGALVIQAAVGFAVFVTNRHRKATQSFLILSIAMICWLASLYFGSTSHDLRICCHKHASRICCRSPDFISVKLPPAFDGQAGRDLARSPSSLRWMDHPGARHHHFLSVKSSREGSTLP